MKELYKLLEDKIKASGYPFPVDGKDFYNDIADKADENGNGSFIVLIKKEDNVSYEAVVDVLDEGIDLHTCKFHVGEESYFVDFDA